ncbi:MAG: A/G-specific adenine glycosylase [Planctomycetota bacterium]
MPRSTDAAPNPTDPSDPADIAAARPRLLRWYRKHKRDLPWRRPAPGSRYPDPYRVLVSEAMLQQTRVDTALPYFERFVAELPTLDALAAADEQRVLRLWQGLGYYRRARNLRAAAQAVAQDHDGQLPSDVDDLLTLPGVGRYTAGAVASIAFNRPAPIVDGNVARVLCRWRRIESPVQARPTQDKLWRLAELFVQGTRTPGDVNQALMELGATVCTPRSPDCPRCPLRQDCQAKAQGDPESLPNKTKPKPLRVEHHDVVALPRGDKLLWAQRPDAGLWSAMWQMPTLQSADPPSQSALIDWAKQTTGLNTDLPAEPLDVFEHLTTHKRLRYRVHLARAVSGRLRKGAGVWRSPEQTHDLPLPNPQRRALSAVQTALEALKKTGTPTGSAAR